MRAFCVTALFILLLQATSTLTPAYATQTRISVSPSFLDILPGSTVTVAVTVTDVTNLALWEVAIEYNASVITCSDAWIPTNDVFQGNNSYSCGRMNKPTIDGLAYCLLGNCITSGTVNVLSGTLFNLNFTGVGNGETTIRIGTLQNPIKPNQFQDWYSYLCGQYPDFNEMPFIEDNGFARTINFHDVAVDDVTSSKTVVGVGYSVSINTTVTDQVYYSENFSVTIYADTTSIASQNVTLTNGTSTTLTFIWNTTGFAYGNYTISAYAEPVAGETITANNNLTGGWVVVSIVGDITGPSGWPDGKVDMRDIGIVAQYYGVNFPNPQYNPNCDTNDDGKIDMKDISLVAWHFGEHYP